MANPYSMFKSLIPNAPLLVGEVISSDGTSHTIRLPDNGVIVARGSASVGDKVFVRDGVVEGPAPTLDYYSIDI